MIRQKICQFENFVNKIFKKDETTKPVINITDPLVYIDPKLYNNICTKQKNAFKFDIESAIECYVCFDEHKHMAPVCCGHYMCMECYDKLYIQNIYKCPICQSDLKLNILHKLFAIFFKIDNDISGVLYIPPIYDTDTDMWIEHESFYHDDQLHITQICTKLISENYFVMACENFDKNIHNFINKSRVKTLKFVMI